MLFCSIVYVYIGCELYKAQQTVQRVYRNSSLKQSNSRGYNDPVMKYAKRASAFILAYCLVWIPASINRSRSSATILLYCDVDFIEICLD